MSHQMLSLEEAAERFWSRVDRSGDCWEWQGQRHPKGYGQAWFRGSRNWKAHRLAWTLTNGPIPNGMHVLHHCDNRPCVNPGHLYLGTNADNVRDREARHRRKPPTGELNPRAKLTADRVLVARRLYSQGRSIEALAREWGIHVDTLRRAARGVAWRGVPMP